MHTDSNFTLLRAARAAGYRDPTFVNLTAWKTARQTEIEGIIKMRPTRKTKLRFRRVPRSPVGPFGKVTVYLLTALVYFALVSVHP